jgi:hypothetical protein
MVMQSAFASYAAHGVWSTSRTPVRALEAIFLFRAGTCEETDKARGAASAWLAASQSFAAGDDRPGARQLGSVGHSGP